MDNTEESPVILSLCSGMRGLERGIERVIGNLTVAAYVEIEAFIIYNLVRQMEQGVLDPAPVWSDLKTFPAEFFRGKIHIITGGYPCQPFSVAGQQNGTEDPRHLWPHIEHITDIIKPPVVFFENVANHLNIGYREVRHSLEEMGYSVKEGIYSAEEVGAPHERKRLFILAIMGNSGYKHLEESNGATSELCKQRSDEMANTHSSGGREDRQSGELRTISTQQPSSDCWFTYERENNQRGLNRWPAGAGPNQYSWEEPRTTKSGVGCTINGYNFRTDLLRMYGNGVVEQTAELAFIDLMNKHFGKNNINK